jgi:hypothetical protein
MYSKLSIGVLGLALMFLPGLGVRASGQNPDQTADTVANQNAKQEPHMAAALGHLHEAEAELQKATPNKGGHREKAMQLVKQAESETEQGVAFYNQQQANPQAAKRKKK